MGRVCTPRVCVWVHGSAAHGVARHMQHVAREVRRAHPSVVCRDEDVVGVLDTPPCDVHHVSFTDALFGPNISAAATEFEQFAHRLGAPVVVTLHDVPGSGRDRARDARRISGYRRVIGCATEVVVSTGEEAARVCAFSARGATVIELPIPPLPLGAQPWAAPVLPDRAVGVLGWVFPGKGHRIALEAAAAAGAAAFVAVGAVAPGQQELTGDLRRDAGAFGLSFRLTGHLDEAAFAAAARQLAVPVASYDGTSASGSLRTWLAAGRIPLAATNADTRALAAAYPGRLRLHSLGDRTALRDDIARALADPSWTRAVGRLCRPDIAAAHLAVYRRAHATGRLLGPHVRTAL